MSIFILSPDQTKCRPFYIAQQLETAAWRLRADRQGRLHGPSEAEARARMAEHPKFKPELEARKEAANEPTQP